MCGDEKSMPKEKKTADTQTLFVWECVNVPT